MNEKNEDIIELQAENTPKTKTDEIAEIKKELTRQRKMMTAILVFIIILACVIIIYLFYKMTIGSIFGHIIGFVTGLFGS